MYIVRYLHFQHIQGILDWEFKDGQKYQNYHLKGQTWSIKPLQIDFPWWENEPDNTMDTCEKQGTYL